MLFIKIYVQVSNKPLLKEYQHLCNKESIITSKSLSFGLAEVHSHNVRHKYSGHSTTLEIGVPGV